jgi:hypothetical protein
MHTAMTLSKRANQKYPVQNAISLDFPGKQVSKDHHSTWSKSPDQSNSNERKR